MTPDPTFERLITEALAAPFEGWDFSYLNGRMIDGALPWDYCARVRNRFAGAKTMLDMGTGGGEILASLAPLPPHTLATEAYAPNVVVARRRLAPLGVKVSDMTADLHGQHLPFADGQFDLVINRHEEYIATEVWRILRPGGRFITQQCGGYGEVDYIEWFKGKGAVEAMDWTVAVASRQLEEAGLCVVDKQEVLPEKTFLDVGAVVYDLRARQLVDDFTVEKYRDRLFAIHQHIREHGRFTVHDQRFLIEAAKPCQSIPGGLSGGSA